MGKRHRYPTGVRPLLITESARRRKVETRIASVLERAGFDEIILPIIDYAEPYAATGAIDSRQTYRFVDRNGDPRSFSGRVAGDAMEGASRTHGQPELPWSARR